MGEHRHQEVILVSRMDGNTVHRVLLGMVEMEWQGQGLLEVEVEVGIAILKLIFFF